MLGDLYAFGLLGAFTLTCLGLDLIRLREQAAARSAKTQSPQIHKNGHNAHISATEPQTTLQPYSEDHSLNGNGTIEAKTERNGSAIFTLYQHSSNIWHQLDLWLGLLTTVLVALAWAISLISKPEAALFGGTVALLGMGVAYLNYTRHGHPPVVASYLEGHLSDSVLAVLAANDTQNSQVINSAITYAKDKPVVFLYLGQRQATGAAKPFEIVDPYLDDATAKKTFSKAEGQARKARITRKYLYRQDGSAVASAVWQTLQPKDVILSENMAESVHNINPDRIRYELTPGGKIVHLLKRW